ncbi:LytTR family DNA-binding domain-containing protein [Dyadobacter sp. CY356]|uniref:LytR/AlgR family response regulator transcription factor n=1 Tax=Dyadobacter sp. CY356 TaxID=2906442 RepID=UPI001F1A31AE|nr:LytTR family DNA-binding domain-containing protein [Dyadobacter sp. CY356]MCF0054502.1 LytTR family DNA-binding domain-containing protein [Dyadobacter sp. CY356]
MIKAVALDDERPALDVLETFCSRLESITSLKSFTRTGEARLYMESNPVDLVFLDINMPKESGLEFAKTVGRQTAVIFTTAYSEFAVESYEVQALDYLLKPFSFERFTSAVQKAQDRVQALRQNAGNAADGEPAHLFFRVDYGLVKIELSDILFIEGLDNYLKIHVRNGRPLVVRMTMKAMLDKLPQTNFLRVHRSYLVALDKIQGIRNKIIAIGDEEIPIGSSYENEFTARFMK